MKLRTAERTAEYEVLLKSMDPNVCQLCEKVPLKEFKYWKIVKNLYPYDLVASVHDMILPLRHVRESELTDEEKKELFEIKRDVINKEYDYIAEAMDKNKSLPNHFHLHLLIGKD